MMRTNTADRCADRLGALLREGGLAEPSDEAQEAGRARLHSRLTRLEKERTLELLTRSRGRRVGPWLALAAAAVAGGAALLWVSRADEGWSSADAVALLPEASPVVVLDAVSGPMDERLADGSTLHLEPRARVRIHKDPTEGGAIIVEQGTVESSFQQDGFMRSVFVGPFHLRAEGAQVTTIWNPADEVVELEVSRGSVRAESPSTGSVAVRAGQRFTANVKKGTHAVLDAAEPEPEPVVSRPSKRVATTAISGPAEPEPTRDAHAMELQQHFAAGDFDGVVQQARAYGVTRCFETCSDEDLRALGDAARYTGEASLAEQSFLALERRPGSAAVAAFLLGRHHEARKPEEALRWYRRYLTREPKGNYAAEALAGTMRLLEGKGHSNEARDVARTYLEFFPQGVHAARARQLLERPGAFSRP